MADMSISIYGLAPSERTRVRISEREADKYERTKYSESARACCLLVLCGVALVSYVLVMSRGVHQSQPVHSKMTSQSTDQLESRHREKRQGSCQVDMCLTKECVHAASSILNSMDTKVDPCHDFYEYACGQWIREHEHKTGLESLFYGINHNAMPEKIDITLTKLLKAGKGVPEELMKTKPYRDLRFFYKSCLDLEEQPEGDIRAVFELLKNMKQFQVGRPFQVESWNLTKALLGMMRMNGAPLFDIIIDADIYDSRRFAIIVTSARHYGLIPSLVGPTPHPRGRPDMQQFLRGKGRRALFGDMSDEMVLLQSLASLRKDAALSGHLTHSAASGDVHDTPRVNIVPTQDLFDTKDVEEKEAVEKSSSSTSDTTTHTPIHTTTHTHTPTHTTTPTYTFTSTTHTPATSTHTPTTTTTTNPPTTSHMPTTTPTVPEDDVNATEEFEDYGDLPANFTEELHIPAVSRKDVYQIFKNNMEMKRIEALSKVTMDLLSHSNTTSLSDIIPLVGDSLTEDNDEDDDEDHHHPSDEDNDEDHHHHQSDEDDHSDSFNTEDVISIITNTFISSLSQMQPDEREELQAQQHGHLYNHYTIDSLQQEFPALEWGYLLGELFNKTINEEDNIYVYYPDYLRNMSSLLLDVHPWVVHYGLLTLYIQDVLMEAASISHDTDPQDFCLQASKNVFGDVMSNMYLHHIGNTTLRNIRTHALSILELLREEVEASIKSSEWLTDKDKEVAMEKLTTLQAEVGAYDNHWDISYVNKSHTGIQFMPNFTFLDAVMEIYREFRVELYRLYHTPIEKGSFIWTFSVQPYVVNAFHMQSANTIVLPEAFFQPPYYVMRGPEYLNYGSTATAMAHEIFHGMDLTGTLFNARGELTRPFSEAARQRLNETVHCYHDLLAHAFYEEVILEYTKITMDIDSNTTLNENLADMAGIRHAFRAYQRWVERHYVEPRLPAITLTPQQLFFLSAAQPYCAVIPDLAKIFLMEMDEHLPNGMRINAIMMNTPEFAQVFNCSKESRMVAHETCHVF